jgi:WD40 repeat protein
MDRCPTAETLRRLLHGLLSEAEAATLTEHVETCAHCSQVLDSLSDPSWDGPLPRLEGYEVLGELGHGGMGVVYKAWQGELRRLVAVKMLHSGVEPGAEPLRRFRIEAEAVARMQHPNIVQIHDVGKHEGRPFLVLELIDGGSLAERLDGKPWPAHDVAVLLEELARAIHEAHQHGIVHRDLKPSNVMLPRGTLQPKVTDFGIAKLLDAGTEQTQTGQILGTPSYMAPEQAAGQTKRIGPATDVYGLGATLYELLTGQPPFQGESHAAVLDQVRNREPAPPRRLHKGVPPDLETVCLKCLAKEPHERYASADALAEDVRRWRQGEPITARRPGVAKRFLLWARRRPALASAAVLFVLLLAVVGVAGAVTWLWRETVSTLDQVKADLEAKQRELGNVNSTLEKKQAELQLLEHKKELLEWDLYRGWLATSQLDFQEGNYTHGCRKLSQCPEGYRGWEWHCLARTYTYHQNLKGHDQQVSSVTFNPMNAGMLATASFDGTVKIWDLAAGKVIRTFSIPTYAFLPKVAFSPNGKLLVCHSGPGELRLWDLTRNSETPVFQDVSRSVSCVAFSPCGNLLAFGFFSRESNNSPGKTAHLEGEIRLLNVNTLKVVSTLKDGLGSVYQSVTFSPCGKLVAGNWISTAKGQAGRIVIWEPETRRVHRTFHEPTNSVLSLTFSPDGKTLATASGTANSALLWDVDKGTVNRILASTGGTSVAFSPDGKLLACMMSSGQAAGEGGVELRETTTGKLTQVFRGFPLPMSVAFSPDGKTLACGNMDGTVKCWEETSFKAVHILQDVQVVACSPNGGYLVTGRATHDPQGNKQVQTFVELKLWDWAAGAEICKFSGPITIGKSAALSPDGKLFASGFVEVSTDRGALSGKVKIWDIKTGKEYSTIECKDPVLSVAFSPDGKFLAWGCSGQDNNTMKTWGEVAIWDTTSNKLVYRMPDDLPVGCLSFSPASDTLASASLLSSAVKLRRAATGEVSRVLKASVPHVFNVAFSPDGNTLAVCGTGSQGGVSLWNLVAGTEKYLLRDQYGALSAVFRPCGKRLVTGSGYGMVRIWDTETGEELLAFKGHHGGVWGVAFNNDGHRLISWGTDPRVWGLDMVKIWDGTPLPSEVKRPVR